MERLDFDKSNLAADIGALLTMALVAVPDAIASAILAVVNPIYSLSALIVGTPLDGDELRVAIASDVAIVQSVQPFGSVEAA